MNAAPFPALIGQLTLVDLLLVLAPLAVVPLGLRLVPLRGRAANRILRLARLMQPAGALAVVVAFVLPTGWTAGVVSLGWLATCALISLAGLVELIETRALRAQELVVAAALGYLSVGAGWMVLSRAGLRPLGFEPAIVELTGVHFHYAGFGATLMAALALRALGDAPFVTRRLAAVAALLVAVGTPITAAGITTGSGALTIAGPVLLAGGILATAWVTAFVIAPALAGHPARWLLQASALGVVLPMLLGVDYALSRVFPIPALNLWGMAAIHGDLNALLFVLVGLWGWRLVPHERRNPGGAAGLAIPPARTAD